MTSHLAFLWPVLWWILFLVPLGVDCYRRTRLPWVSARLLLLLAVASVVPTLPAGLLLALWIVTGLALVLLHVPPLRRLVVTGPLFAVYRRLLPPMSSTEREALNAGDVGWEGELFTGKPRWEKLRALPPARLSAEEQAFLDGPVEELCARLDDWKITHEWGDLPPEIWRFLKEKGFFALIIPKAYGGLAFSNYAHSQVLLRVASRSMTAASVIAVPNSLGPAELLLHYGTEEQKAHYLPRLARGEEVPCFALTSPAAGSDAASMTDRGRVVRTQLDGREVLALRLDFDKRYITLAPVATVIGLAVRVFDPERLLGGEVDRGITCLLLPRTTPGLEVGRRHFPLNTPFANGPVRGRGIVVPLDAVIGGPAMIGQGWRMLMENLAAGRSISLPANATGAAKLAVRTSGAYARVRRQFHVPIARFEGVAQALARMGGTLYAMDAVRTVTLAASDAGGRSAVASAIVKAQVTEMGRRVALDAMDVHGGKGIMLGPRNYLARGYEAVPIAITVEGANLLTRNLIIFGQGAIRAHPYVFREMEAARDSDAAAGRRAFDRLIVAHVGFFLSNAVRAFVMGLHAARFAPSPVRGPLRRYYQHLNRYSAAFALLADGSMFALGGSLKRREALSARLADMLSYLYIASCVLKHHEDRGMPADEEDAVVWACRDLIYAFQEQAHGLLRNFPNRSMAAFLRLAVFPTGRSYSAPSDALSLRLAGRLTEDSPLRDALVAGSYATDPAAGPVALLERALGLAPEAEAIERRLRTALADAPPDVQGDRARLEFASERGLVDARERDLLVRFYDLVDEIVAVDDFDARELGTHPLPSSA
jgi:acyl-CoA dehydrogenase